MILFKSTSLKLTLISNNFFLRKIPRIFKRFLFKRCIKTIIHKCVLAYFTIVRFNFKILTTFDC